MSLQFNNGRVTLNAENAPIRTILLEWARLGGTRIVNAERVGGAPVTLELTDVPERSALDILLRTAAGYVVTARQEPGGPSTLGGVIILATSSPPRTQSPVTFGAAIVQQQRPFPEDIADERPGVVAAPVLPGVATAPVLPGVPTAPTVPGPSVVRVGSGAPFGQPEATPPPAPARPVTTLQTLPGTSRPGEITPPPQQPQPAR